MTNAHIVLDADFTISDLDRRLFGTFVEHLGRCVYTGIFEPEHPTADKRGFRQDVLDLVRDLGPTIIRIPAVIFFLVTIGKMVLAQLSRDRFGLIWLGSALSRTDSARMNSSNGVERQGLNRCWA